MKKEAFWYGVCVGLLVMLLLAMVAISNASAQDILLPTTQATVAWDRPTTYTSGTAIEPSADIRYKVYIKPYGADGSGKTELTNDWIQNTTFVLTIPGDGNIYAFGIYAVKFVDNVAAEPAIATIAWSDLPAYCQNGETIGLYVQLIPNPAGNLRPAN